VPFLMLLILMIVQFAVWEHASAIAQDAAAEALAAARVQGGTAAAGQQLAAHVLSQVGGGALTGAKVTVTRTATTVTVQISAAAGEVLPLPGLSFTVTAIAAGPVERFVSGG
jgi:Flp pilus assembly protein TadG